MDRDDETLARIAQSLRDRRVELGLSQSELAERLGLTQAYLSKLETAGATTQLRRLVAVLGAVGLDLVALPRTHPAVREERSRPLAPVHRKATPSDELRRALQRLDLSRVSDPEAAARFAALRDVLADGSGEGQESPRARNLVRSLRSLAQSDEALSLVDPSVRAVLLALRDAEPHR
ncbi:helix-turn-helix domain-containing protein [Cellulomonas fimi]|uniref:Helix-turn-helix domain protein n=1 Tax=Cellulomonas fimi (strain ATCC 484 / DSM 20113 / JCM 1341 / CCUG 24087 / LMG 16345 / NBRC 15513 / NCIMB 8980 / NCTC 7547 / NRS-133) TaxID=590998 RepID=F4H0R1_CELFA|nr:helix-turn-helix domain-containing protein [Cellulomonas fimi]AEE45034.1 helix-turn-helix domain protein [Cellulomonas fimi ATCC 484]NNH07991.1 helix-turn-helix domain-containing protein [Cellulomonas fimi]VEH28038.1 antitoxin HipB [Cellulomonas fimi]